MGDDALTRDIAILIVEDDDDAAHVAEVLLKDAARPARALTSRAVTMAEAMDRLSEGPYPDVVLLDLGLPDTRPADDPLLPVRALTALPDAPPIVVLTGEADHELGVAAIRHGAQDFVEKQRLATETWRVWRTLVYAVERAERINQVEQQRTRLLQTNALLQHFGATIAHDIKGPIVKTAMTVRTLRAHGDSIADATRAELLEAADRNLTALAAHIDALVDDVITTVDHRREPVALEDLATWLGEVLPQADHVRLRLEVVDADEPVWGRAGALRQILHNLIGNALAHNPDREVVTVRVSVDRTSHPGDVVLKVEDDGDGIPEELRDTIFQPGVRGDDLGSGGIGLAAVRMSADAMGGTATLVESELGGAAFAVRLPQRGARDGAGPA